MSKSSWFSFRDKRNRLLEGSDWTQMPDSPLSDSKKAEWAAYRKELRDLPGKWPADVDTTNTDPYIDNDVTWSWPTKPS
tara:strand:- start:226 stop:462 length:237 start_codon:yes stop_codon:yes gene_type:complete